MATQKRAKVRYAVVGLGYFAQAAVLPAFARAKNSELVALFSDDPDKLDVLGARYKVPHCLPYECFDEFVASRPVDAVYIALPNALHADYAIRAARAGIHVLCEKPLATTEAQCLEMIEAATLADVKLMVAYRLHFEATHLAAIEAIRDDQIGEPRLFNSVFTMQVRDGNTRLSAHLTGGPLYDIGIYCINAARYLFRDEPIEVMGLTGRRDDDERFSEVDEHFSGVLRFHGERLASFSVSFGACDVSHYEVVGTEGHLRVEPAYSHAEDLVLTLHNGGRPKRRRFRKRDQIAPELIYFSQCILEGRTPEPSGVEGLADVRVIRALLGSAESGRAITLAPLDKHQRPDIEQEIHVPSHRMPKLVGAVPPTR